MNHLVSWNMLIQSYLVNGIFETAAGYFGYLAILYYYGFSSEVIWRLEKIKSFARPKISDIFIDNPFINFGNSNLPLDCRSAQDIKLNLYNGEDAKYDLRHILLECDHMNGHWKKLYWERC